MAFPNTSWGDVLTTTINSRTKKLADNVTKNNGLLKSLSERGRIKYVSGGATILQELEYAENSTYIRFSGFDTLNTTQSQVMTAAEFNWTQAAVAVLISGLERMQNSGSEQKMIDLLEARVGNAEKTITNNVSLDCYSDGTANGGKQIGGLDLLVPIDPTTGTAGGINRATWTFWRSQKFSGVTDGGAAVSAANIQKYMLSLYLRCSRGPDRPKVILADNNYYQLFSESMTAIQRVTNSKDAAAGFSTLAFQDNVPVMFDGGIGGGATANTMYFLNTDYIFLRPHRDYYFVSSDDRMSVNQDAIVKYIFFGGNMTMSNAQLQGRLIA
jgi:hypothetical protein